MKSTKQSQILSYKSTHSLFILLIKSYRYSQGLKRSQLKYFIVGSIIGTIVGAAISPLITTFFKNIYTKMGLKIGAPKKKLSRRY